MNDDELVRELNLYGNGLPEEYGCVPVPQATVLLAARRIKEMNEVLSAIVELNGMTL